ncbi:MAG: hypothetical protein H6711_15450 [Myxococcales bacterium]|nr:hypothetical protein [Myxococcales bacterium]
MSMDAHRRRIVTRRVVGLLVAAASCTDVRRPAPEASATIEGTAVSAEVVYGESPAVLRAAVIDHDEALLAIADRDDPSLTRFDSEASPRWTQRLPGRVRTDWSDIFAVDGDRVIVWGSDIQVRALSDGSLRRIISEVPTWLLARRSELLPLRPSARDGRLFVPLTDIESTWITAFDAGSGAELWHIERPGQSPVTPLLGGYLRMDVSDGRLGAQDERIEVLDAATGASVWSVLHVDACEAGDWLVAATPDGAVAIWDGERAAPRPLISDVVWPPGSRLVDCHRSGARLWLVVESTNVLEPLSWTVLGPVDAGLRPRLRVPRVPARTGALGKWLPLVTDSPRVGVALLDIETGHVAWSQDPAVDPIHYLFWSTSHDAFLLEAHVDRVSYYMALDPSSGAALGGAAITGASLLARNHNVLWFVAREQVPGALPALAVLDARTLQPLTPPGRGITVTDRGEVVRNAWRSAGPDAGATRGLVELPATSPPRGP